MTIFGAIAMGIALVFLYYIENISKSLPFLAPLNKISNVIYGTGIYGKKVSLTIAEAGTYNISRSVMSYGPAIYWLAFLIFLSICLY